MMKILLPLITLLFITGVNAQNISGIATYKTDRKLDLKMEGEGMDDAMQEQMAAMLRKQFQKEFTLTFNADESIYREVESLEKPAPAAAGGINIVISGGSDVQYRNLKDNSYAIETEIMDKAFLIKDSLTINDWTLEKETKNIGNYTCFKATRSEEVKEMTMTSESDDLVEVTKIKNTTVWYTLDIPVKHGPDSFWGLPGLILEVNDGDLTILCSKIVLNPGKEILIEQPDKGKVVTAAEFEAIQKKKNEEMMERFKSDGRRKDDGNRVIMKIGG